MSVHINPKVFYKKLSDEEVEQKKQKRMRFIKDHNFVPPTGHVCLFCGSG